MWKCAKSFVTIGKIMKSRKNKNQWKFKPPRDWMITPRGKRHDFNMYHGFYNGMQMAKKLTSFWSIRIISENKKQKQSPSLFVWFILYPLQCVVSILIHLPPLYSGSIHFTILNLIHQVFIYSPIQPLYIVIQGDPVKMRLHGRL